MIIEMLSKFFYIRVYAFNRIIIEPVLKWKLIWSSNLHRDCCPFK